MVNLYEVRTVLQRLEYPATRGELIDMARRQGASEEVLQRLQQLPEHRYGSANTALDALRGLE